MHYVEQHEKATWEELKGLTSPFVQTLIINTMSVVKRNHEYFIFSSGVSGETVRVAIVSKWWLTTAIKQHMTVWLSLVRAAPCQGEGRRFKSGHGRLVTMHFTVLFVSNSLR